MIKILVVDFGVEDIGRTHNGLEAAIKSEVVTLASIELTRLTQLGFIGKVKC